MRNWELQIYRNREWVQGPSLTMLWFFLQGRPFIMSILKSATAMTRKILSRIADFLMLILATLVVFWIAARDMHKERATRP